MKPSILPMISRASLLGMAWTFLLVGQPAFAATEIAYPAADFAKLDTFEGVNLEDADKLYAKSDFKGAYAAYKAYSFEFAKGKALPYVLLRMGRCLHQLEKRNAAITAYQDVVDYFPDNARYAAAALYYIGECHGQNGDEAKQTAVWARMVKDDGYVAQPNSGTALTFLGKQMEKLGKFDEAAEYHWRTAVNFLKSNPEAAKGGREAVLFHYAVRKPDHDKLKEFYVAASGFDGQGRNTDKPEEDGRYWGTVLATATRATGDEAKKACGYWVAKMGDRFTDNDDLRRQWCDARFVSDQSRESWAAEMEKQFKSKPATLDRVLQWCRYYERDPKIRSAFFEKEAKAFLAGLKTDGKLDLMAKLRGFGMNDEAQLVMRSVNTQGMSDEELAKFAELAASYEPEEAVLRIFARMKDPLAATKARFDYYNSRSHRNPPFMEKALAEIPELRKSPQYAGAQLSWAKATLLQGLGRYEEAIKAFRSANRQPDSTWEISKCQEAMKQYPQAIQTLRELESVAGLAPQAALRIANVHRSAGDKAREVDQLRIVLKRYPKSGESSEAHRRLESYGVALTGGEAEAEE